MTISGRGFRISGLSPSQERTIRTVWPQFIGTGAMGATTELGVYRTPESTFKKLDRWVYELDFDYQPAAVRMVGLDLMARIDLDPSLEATLWTATESPETFHGTFENFLRVVVAYAALERGGVLAHSAAVVDGNDAWLFLGHSGAGKSTVCRLGLESGLDLLSDDLNPILPRGGSAIEVAGSPFLGDHGARAPAPHRLTAIYRLQQGTVNAVSPIGAAETLASLMACAPYINRDHHRAGPLTTSLVSLARRVPAFVLTFRRNGGFWPLLERRTLAGPGARAQAQG